MTFEKLKPRIKPLPEGMSAFHPAVLAATCFGIGRLRPAPGTLGTLAALPVGYAISYAGGIWALFAAAVLLTIAGTFAAERYGAASGEKDDQSIVIDEAAGLWIAAIPAETHIGLWITAFLLFRFFDIYKPWPASYFDKRKSGGLDVMMDDVIAGIFAMVGVGTGATWVLLQ